VILRWQNFTKAGGTELSSELVTNQIQFDPEIPPDIFSLQIGDQPQFAAGPSGEPVTSGTNIQGSELAPSVSFSGDLYFNLVDRSGRKPAIRLVKLPADCLLNKTPCPEPEEIPGYPNNDEMVVPLTWSRDGTLAAVPYSAPDNPDRFALYLFNPVDSSWKALAEFKGLYAEVAWSPDGKWIAFRPQTVNIDDLFVIRPDGSELTNITSAQYPDQERHFILGGWLGDELIYVVNSPIVAEAYRWKPGDTSPHKMADLTGSYGWLLPSPDGNLVILMTADPSGGLSLALMNPAGKITRTLASFQDLSLGLYAWDTDGKRLAFAVYHPQIDTCEVYLIGTDGTGLRQVYSGQGVQALIFSLDGKFLAIEGGDASGRHIYLSPTGGGKQQILQAPGLRLDLDWQGLSWRPPILK
jgi:Tol biopolymer transport system component